MKPTVIQVPVESHETLPNTLGKGKLFCPLRAVAWCKQFVMDMVWICQTGQ